MTESQTPTGIKRLLAAARRYLTGTSPWHLRRRWRRHTSDRVLPTHTFASCIYFAGQPSEIDHLRKWYAQIQALHLRRPTVVVCRRVDTALALLDGCPVPVIWANWVADIERFVATEPLRLVVYVDHCTENFQMFRLNGVLHVYAAPHPVERPNPQIKCYDYTLVTRQTDLDVVSSSVLNYLASRRVWVAESPQADGSQEASPWVGACLSMIAEAEGALRGRGGGPTG